MRDHVSRSPYSNNPQRPDFIEMHKRMRAKLFAFLESPVRTYQRYKETDTSLESRYARAIAAGDAMAGCTVHEVTEDLDAGPILGQARLPILPQDTAETLAARVLTLEHRLYPAVLRRFAAGDRSPVTLD